MNIQIKTTGLEMSQSIQSYIDKKIGSLSKFLEESAIIHIEVAKTSDHHKHGDIFRAEFRTHSHGKDFYVSKETSDLYAAIDILKDEVHRVLSTSKEKKISFVRKGGAKVKAMLKGLWNRNN